MKPFESYMRLDPLPNQKAYSFAFEQWWEYIKELVKINEQDKL